MSDMTPDPAENKPSQAEGDVPEDQSVQPAVDPDDNKPSQAEGDAPADAPGDD
ncbi:hypothetical protein ACH9D2_18445 [Kocuria sp. M4R2S49]|uniref:hypothetical protein n=1 Tax=Kocuria rhizosphaericola TaxID=3376284 RepID=UPI0037AA224E